MFLYANVSRYLCNWAVGNSQSTHPTSALFLCFFCACSCSIRFISFRCVHSVQILALVRLCGADELEKAEKRSDFLSHSRRRFNILCSGRELQAFENRNPNLRIWGGTIALQYPNPNPRSRVESEIRQASANGKVNATRRDDDDAQSNFCWMNGWNSDKTPITLN